MAMELPANNDPQDIFDHHFAMDCPHCQARSNVSAISIPRWELLDRFRPEVVGICYRCDSCNSPIFLRFRVIQYPQKGNKHPVRISDTYELVQRPLETFEYKYLPEEVAADFREALTCYSNLCYNAFAAMCRRCLQSTSMVLGAEGSTKVQNQLEELKALSIVDDEGFDQLKQIVLSGHDGAHPHLPALNAARAGILLELMKDVLYQLFVRKAKVREAAELRKQSQGRV
jgi:hypothetical protein